MIDATNIPSFEEWRQFVFEHGYSDFAWRPKDSEELAEARDARMQRITPVTLGEYMTRLFESPAAFADLYTSDQIGDAVWFLFGTASSYFHKLRYDDVPENIRVRCFSSVLTMYTDLFDLVCNRRGSEPDRDVRNTDHVDGAVYMIWDMDQINGAIMFPEKAPYLVEPCLAVLEGVLTRCRTSSCLISALHGIAHIYTIHKQYPDKSVAYRVQGMIDQFLTARSPPDWLREYAVLARDGAVQ